MDSQAIRTVIAIAGLIALVIALAEAFTNPQGPDWSRWGKHWENL
mgnify:CR=1 FL=1